MKKIVLILSLLATPALAETIHVTHPTKSLTATDFQLSNGRMNAITNPITQLTLDDLNSALADANSQTPPDTRHAQCWQALIPLAQQWQIQLGVASAAQKFFDVSANLGKPILPDSVVTACALTVNDMNTSFANIALAIGLKAVAIPKLPGIP